MPVDGASVDSDVCVWCKEPATAEGVELHGIDTNESICSECLNDCRRWKRQIHFWTIVSTDIQEEDRRAINRAAHDAGREEMDARGYHGDEHPAVISNASEGTREVDEV